LAGASEGLIISGIDIFVFFLCVLLIFIFLQVLRYFCQNFLRTNTQ
jgi:hypothetical protein